MARWALVVGSKDRRELCARAVAALERRGLRVGGVVQEAVLRDDERHGYETRHVATGERVHLGRRGTAAAGVRPEAVREFCSFFFDDDAFTLARGWIEADCAVRDVVVVDEVSKLEVAGAGHHDAIRSALGSPALVVLSVRADQLFAVVERFGLDEAVTTLDAPDAAAVAAFADAVEAAVR